jgi:iron complex transport system ATP-binding protein
VTRLDAIDLTVRRGGREVLDRVGLGLEAGVFTVVIGPNGAGKSTLLAALAGLVRPDTGEVRLDGWPLAATPRRALARRRAYLPQNPRVEWPLPVERLVALGLTPHLPPFGPLPPAMAGAVDAALAACDLSERRDQPATTLSGGELARAMLARALVGDPELLIVDEPTAGLDPRHALDAMARLAALARAGKLVVAAVHDLTLAARFADRIAALRAGRLLGEGPTASTLTAGLLADAFEVEAEVSGAGAGARVDFDAPRARPEP